MTKQIPLTQGKFAVVDDDVFAYLMQWTWYASKNRYTWYACRKENGKTIVMHRVITNAPDGVLVDHCDNDGLHNWRLNLRFCDHAQNQSNKRLSKNNATGYKGVTWNKQKKKYQAYIQPDQKFIHLGFFDTPKEAALVYDIKAQGLFGEFAWLNFPVEVQP